MDQNRNAWIFGCLLVAILMALYLVSAYDDIYERRIAYLLDPVSDDVFMIEMAPSLNRYKKYAIFIPFKSLAYVEPDGVEYIGKFHNEIAEFKADMDLLKNNIKVWREKQDKEFKKLISNISQDCFPLELLDVEYFLRPIQDANSYMSETLANILRGHDIDEKEILVVDAVIFKRVISDNRKSNKPVTIRIIRKALLFKGLAAYVLSEQGLENNF